MSVSNVCVCVVVLMLIVGISVSVYVVVSTIPDIFCKNISVCVISAILVVLTYVMSIPMPVYLLCFVLS